MADIAKLEAELLAAVAAAKDYAALEAVRVSALGKKGSISELLKSLGTITPEERKIRGPLINGLRDLIRFLSAALTLQPGTLITTGTPAGVSKLADGDHLKGTIEGIGTMELKVAAER